MSVALSASHEVTDTGVSSLPPLSAVSAGPDASVLLSLSHDNLREVVRRLVLALVGHASEGDLLRIRRGNLIEAGPALDRVAADPAIVSALSFTLSGADADDLAAALDALSTVHPAGGAA